MTKSELRQLALKIMEIKAIYVANSDLAVHKLTNEEVMFMAKNESAQALIKTMFHLAETIYIMGQQEPNKD